MADIFISYARADKSKAKILAKTFEQRGWSVWWDKVIPVGKAFDAEIEEALESARCVVVLWSKTSISSYWVGIEAAEGARRGVLVPAMLEDVQVPLEFRRIQSANLQKWQGSPSHPDLKALMRSVAGLIAAPPNHVLKKSDDRPANSSKSRKAAAKNFKADLAELLKYTKTDLKGIKGKTKTLGEEYISYVPRFSLAGSKNNLIRCDWSGNCLFACDLVNDKPMHKAISVFDKRAREIRDTLSQEWSIEEKSLRKRKEFIAINKKAGWRIDLILSVFGEKFRVERGHIEYCDVRFFLRPLKLVSYESD